MFGTYGNYSQPQYSTELANTFFEKLKEENNKELNQICTNAIVSFVDMFAEKIK
jgi:hypothetical protein